MQQDLNGVAVSQQRGITVEMDLRSRQDVDWLIRTITVAQELAFPPIPLFDVVLVSCGDRKINVIKEIRNLMCIGLREAKDMSETPNATVLRGVDEPTANHANRVLSEQGATVLVRSAV